MQEYDNDQLTAAFAAVFATTPSAPDDVSASVAVGLAQEIAPEEDVSTGATAALCGLLVGAKLAQAESRLPAALPTAVQRVRELGRTRVIARHCDLAGVASVEHALADGFGSPNGPRRDALLQLFELGFAIGLAASYA